MFVEKFTCIDKLNEYEIIGLVFTITLCAYYEELVACNRTYETSDAFVKEKGPSQACICSHSRRKCKKLP